MRTDLSVVQHSVQILAVIHTHSFICVSEFLDMSSFAYVFVFSGETVFTYVTSVFNNIQDKFPPDIYVIYLGHVGIRSDVR